METFNCMKKDLHTHTNQLPVVISHFTNPKNHLQLFFAQLLQNNFLCVPQPTTVRHGTCDVQHIVIYNCIINTNLLITMSSLDPSLVLLTCAYFEYRSVKLNYPIFNCYINVSALSPPRFCISFIHLYYNLHTSTFPATKSMNPVLLHELACDRARVRSSSRSSMSTPSCPCPSMLMSTFIALLLLLPCLLLICSSPPMSPWRSARLTRMQAASR